MTFSSLDTETINGYARLIATPERYLWVNSIHDILEFLRAEREKGITYLFTWNLSYDTDAILKYLNTFQLNKLNDGHEIEIYSGKRTYKINMIKHKSLHIGFNGKRIILTDLPPFYVYMSLDEAAKTYLGDKKIDSPVVRAFKLNQKIWSPESLEDFVSKGTHKSEIEKYCMHDASLTLKLGQSLDDKCLAVYGFQMKGYVSQAGIGARKTDLHCGWDVQIIDKKKIKYRYYPEVQKMTPAAEMALLSYHGGWFESWKRGSFGRVLDLDISSAYPNHQRKYPNLRDGEFWTVDEETQISESDYYGWLMCSFDCPFIPYDTQKIVPLDMFIDDDRQSVVFENSLIVYPDGNRMQPITLVEYRFLKEYGFPVELHRGYIWRPNEFALYEKPFSWINEIYLAKEKYRDKEPKKKSMEYMLTKIGMTGTYGKTIQRKGGRKPLYNPFYGSYITAETRVQVAKYIIDNHLEDRVINIATDGILLMDGEIPPLPEKEELGSWTLSIYESALVLGNGIMYLGREWKNGQWADGFKQKGRGLGKDFDLLKIAQQNRGLSKKIVSKRRPLHLSESIKHVKKLTKEDINLFVKIGRTLDLNSEHKRNWEPNLTFGDMLERVITSKRIQLINGKMPEDRTS